MAPRKFRSIPNSIVSIYDLAGKRKRNSPSWRRDTNETGSSSTYLPTRANGTLRSKTKAPSVKGSSFAYSDINSSLDLDHWDNVLEDYLGTDSENVLNSQSFGSDSALDQSGRFIANETPTLTSNASTAGTSNKPIRIESSPEKTTEVPSVEVPRCSVPRPRRNPGPPNFTEKGGSSCRWHQEQQPRIYWTRTRNRS